MIDIKTIAYIRQRHYGEHWPVGTIAAELGLHHQTVAGALCQEGPRAAPPPRPSQLDAYLGLSLQPEQATPCRRPFLVQNVGSTSRWTGPASATS